MNKYQYKVQGVDYDVEIVDVEGNIAKVKCKRHFIRSGDETSY